MNKLKTKLQNFLGTKNILDETQKLSKSNINLKKEIEETEMVLARSNLANALIIGDPGTGRKSIIEAIAQRCYLNQSLPEIKAAAASLTPTPVAKALSAP